MRVALGTFLEEYGLPKDIVANGDQWSNFVFLLCGVVSEVPLVYSGAAKNPQTIKRLTMTRGEKDADGGFRLTWTARLFTPAETRTATPYPHNKIIYN